MPFGGRPPANYGRQRYTPGGVTTTAEVPANPMPVPMAMDQLLALQRRSRPVGPGSSGVTTVRNEAPIVREDPTVAAANKAEARVRLLQANALQQGPPLRMVTGPGIIPGYMPDVNAMSGIQRKIFLPEGSQQTNAGEIGDTERSKRGAVEFQNFQNQGAQREAIERQGGQTGNSGEQAYDDERGFAAFEQARAIAEAEARRRLAAQQQRR